MMVSLGIVSSPAAEIVRVVQGTVREASTGEPIAGVTLAAAEVVGRELRVMSDSKHQAMTDASGRYSLSVPNLGRYFVVAVQSPTHFTGPPRRFRGIDDPFAVAVVRVRRWSRSPLARIDVGRASGEALIRDEKPDRRLRTTSMPDRRRFRLLDAGPQPSRLG